MTERVSWEFLLGLHSGVRWIIVATTVIAAIWFLLGWLGWVSSARTDRWMMLAFTFGLDIEVMIGIVTLIASVLNGQFRGVAIIHAIYIFLAVGIAHIISRRWKNAKPKIRARNTFLGIIAVSVLIAIAVIVVVPGAGFFVG